jgi:L,D-transpeptidase ErfK/SrfK
MGRRVCAMAFSVLLLWTSLALAGGAYSVGADREVVGMPRRHALGKGESLYEVARLYRMGFNEIADANPGLDALLPRARAVIVPSEWVLPRVRREGVVVNLAELRLYHFLSVEGRTMVRTYPVGVGTAGFETPLGRYTVSMKLVEPTWYVPPDIRAREPGLPPKVLPGEDNPLGKYALRLSDTQYFIHGTNKPLGIGQRVSHGCIRLYPEDIAELFSSVQKGTPVEIIYQPVKAGVKDGAVYVEVHKDYLGREKDVLQSALRLLREKGLARKVDRVLLARAVREKRGLPVLVGALNPALAEKNTNELFSTRH